MSETDAVLTQAHFDYLASRTVAEDDFLRQLKAAAREAGIPPIWITAAQASFMQILLKLVKAHEVVEIGTLAGYSAIAMARALTPPGHVWTLEVSDSFADFAEAWVAKSDVADCVRVLRGDARGTLLTLSNDSADVMFVDADKAGYPDYLQHAKRILRSGGLLMVDNAFAFGEILAGRPTDPDTPAVRRFNEIMAADRAFHAIIVPLGDGMWVGVKS
jgi:O-methyltransferase